MRVAALIPGLGIALAGFATGERIQPDHASARTNAHHIFNALHSAGRQWGSSINHNGLGFIPAVVPKGTLLYHGSHTKDTPKEPDWLAFETEHGENFAFSRIRRKIPDDDGGNDQSKWTSRQQQPQEQGVLKTSYPPLLGEKRRGYLHTYQATRDLNLLYLDGMAAAKSHFGPLDSQDYVLRGFTEDGVIQDDWGRAADLCRVIRPWGYEGIIRMEVGFEIIHCDFHDGGIALISQTRTMVGEDKLTEHDAWLYQLGRAASRRYDGIGANRMKLDLSSMVSGFFYPMNISSRDPDRPELLRLGSANPDELKAVRETVGKIARQPRKYTVDWQAVVDQIVTRFADRFAMLVAEEGVTDEMFLDDLEGLTLTYFDAPPLPDDDKARKPETKLRDDYKRREEQAMERCSRHYLLPAIVFEEEYTAQDELIYTAVAHVMRTICKTTQHTWLRLVQKLPSSSLSQAAAEAKSFSSGGHPEEGGSTTSEEEFHTTGGMEHEAVKEARATIHELMKTLGWPFWKRKQPCAPNAFQYVAMWPFGTKSDYWDPDCRSVQELMQMKNWIGYWDLPSLKDQ